MKKLVWWRSGLLIGGSVILPIAIVVIWLTQPLLTVPKPDFVCEAIDQARLQESVQFLVEQTPTRSYADLDGLEKAATVIELFAFCIATITFWALMQKWLANDGLRPTQMLELFFSLLMVSISHMSSPVARSSPLYLHF